VWEPQDIYVAAISMDAPALRVYMVLWSLGERRQDVVVFAGSQRQIAKALDVGDKTIDRALATLEAQNAVVEIDRRPGYPRTLQINPPRRLRTAKEAQRLPPFAAAAASSLARQRPRINDPSNLTLPPQTTLQTPTTLPTQKHTFPDATAKNDAPPVLEGTRTRTAPAPTQSSLSPVLSSLPAPRPAVAAENRTSAQTAAAAKTKDVRERTEQEQARADALIIAGISDPALSDLARLDITPEQIRKTAENVRSRGKGPGVIIAELRALPAKREAIARRERTAQKPVEDRRGAATLATDAAEADFAAVIQAKALATYHELAAANVASDQLTRAVRAALAHEPDTLARLVCGRANAPPPRGFEAWNVTPAQLDKIAADPRISSTIRAIRAAQRTQNHGKDLAE
jgi:hypothetical protein